MITIRLAVRAVIHLQRTRWPASWNVPGRPGSVRASRPESGAGTGCILNSSVSINARRPGSPRGPDPDCPRSGGISPSQWQPARPSSVLETHSGIIWAPPLEAWPEGDWGRWDVGSGQLGATWPASFSGGGGAQLHRVGHALNGGDRRRAAAAESVPRSGRRLTIIARRDAANDRPRDGRPPPAAVEPCVGRRRQAHRRPLAVRRSAGL